MPVRYHVSAPPSLFFGSDSGARIKARKRNITVALDPASFAEAIIDVFEDTRQEGLTLEQQLDAANKVIDNSDLDFSTYGETLFEIIFMGGRMSAGVKVVEGEKLPDYLMGCEATHEKLLPFIILLQKIIRRRAFLIKSLENVLCKLIQSLEHFDKEGREKLGLATAMIFQQKLGVQPENVFEALMNSTLVSKGTSLDFFTMFAKDFLRQGSFDDLLLILRKGKVEDKLIEFFPVSKRTPDNFNNHFESAGLHKLVEHFRKKLSDVKLKELGKELSEMISQEEEVESVIDFVKSKTEEASLTDSDVIRTVWTSIMDAIEWSPKNVQQNLNNAMRQVKRWAKLLGAICSKGKHEVLLIYSIQTYCYENTKLMKLFPQIVRTLYDGDVLAEDTILYWYGKGQNPKGRQIFLRDMEPFVRWLEEAEEEEED